MSKTSQMNTKMTFSSQLYLCHVMMVEVGGRVLFFFELTLKHATAIRRLERSRVFFVQL